MVPDDRFPPGFRMTCRQEPTATVIAVAGDIDLSTVSDFSDALQAGVRRPNTDVLVDMQDLTFIDANGLGALIQAHHSLRGQEGGRILIRNVPPSARRLFELTDVQLFDIGTLTST